MDNKCRHCGCGLFPNEMMICAACYARLNEPDQEEGRDFSPEGIGSDAPMTEKPEPLYDPRQAQGYPSKDEQ